MPDGSTLIEATGVTAENMRGKFIAGLIGIDSKDDQIAMLANGQDSEEHSEELIIFKKVRSKVKKSV